MRYGVLGVGSNRGSGRRSVQSVKSQDDRMVKCEASTVHSKTALYL